MRIYTALLLFVIFRLGSYQVAGQLPAAISKGAEILLNGMGEDFNSATFSKLASVAISFLSDLVTGGVFNSFGNGNDKTLREISDSLEQLSDQQKQILTEVQKLSIKISSIVKEVIIAGDEREIKGCIDFYELLLQNPHSGVYMDQVKQCGSIHTNVRSISRILKTKSIFSDIKNEFGYCNGQAIVKVLEYLFYLQFEGYSVLLVSHQIQGKSESQLYINEYKDVLDEINQAIGEEFTTCANDFCKGVPLKIKQIPESESEDDDQKILDILHKTFPWYGFYVFKLKPGSTYTLKGIKSEIGEFVNKTEKADVVFLYVNLVYLKNDFIRGDLDLNSYIWDLSSNGSVCKHVKIGIKKDQLISKAGEKILLSERTANDISFFSIESRVLKCNGSHRNINDCSYKPISYATSIHINTLRIAIINIYCVIFIAMLM